MNQPGFLPMQTIQADTHGGVGDIDDDLKLAPSDSTAELSPSSSIGKGKGSMVSAAISSVVSTFSTADDLNAEVVSHNRKRNSFLVLLILTLSCLVLSIVAATTNTVFSCYADLELDLSALGKGKLDLHISGKVGYYLFCVQIDVPDFSAIGGAGGSGNGNQLPSHINAFAALSNWPADSTFPIFLSDTVGQGQHAAPRHSGNLPESEAGSGSDSGADPGSSGDSGAPDFKFSAVNLCVEVSQWTGNKPSWITSAEVFAVFSPFVLVIITMLLGALPQVSRVRPLFFTLCVLYILSLVFEIIALSTLMTNVPSDWDKPVLPPSPPEKFTCQPKLEAGAICQIVVILVEAALAIVMAILTVTKTSFQGIIRC